MGDIIGSEPREGGLSVDYGDSSRVAGSPRRRVYDRDAERSAVGKVCRRNGGAQRGRGYKRGGHIGSIDLNDRAYPKAGPGERYRRIGASCIERGGAYAGKRGAGRVGYRNV